MSMSSTNERLRTVEIRPTRPRARGLPDVVRYGDGILVGPSPTRKQIEALARAGVRSLLNLNTEGEPGQVLSPNVEASWAHTFDLEHARVSVSPKLWSPGTVDRFLETLERLPGPVYVHSLKARRAASLLTIHLGLARGCSGHEALQQARELGLDCGLEWLERFVASEVDRRIAEARVTPGVS